MDRIRECYNLIKHNFYEADNILEGVVQKYFEMVLAVRFPGDNAWKQLLEKEVQDGINGNYPNKYKAAWAKIATKGIDNYSIADMDITIISALLKGGCFREESKSVRECLEILRKARNEKAHEFKNIDENDITVLKNTGDRMHDWIQSVIKGCRDFIFAVLSLQQTSEKPIPTYDDRLAYQIKYREELTKLEGRARSSYSDFIISQKDQPAVPQVSPVASTHPITVPSQDITKNLPKLVLSVGYREGRQVVCAKNSDGTELSNFTFLWSVKKTTGAIINGIKHYSGPHLDIKSFKAGDTVICKGRSDDYPGHTLNASLILSSDIFGQPAKPVTQTERIDRNPLAQTINALPIKVEIKKEIEESEGSTYPVYKVTAVKDDSWNAFWWIPMESERSEGSYKLFYGGSMPYHKICKVKKPEFVNRRYMCVVYREYTPIARSVLSEPVQAQDFVATSTPKELSGTVSIDGKRSYGDTLNGKADKTNAPAVASTPENNVVQGQPDSPVKKKRPAPGKNADFKVVEVTENHILVSAADGMEFSIDGTTFSENGRFEELEAGKQYTVYVRYRETETHLPSNRSKFEVTTQKQATQADTELLPTSPASVDTDDPKKIVQGEEPENIKNNTPSDQSNTPTKLKEPVEENKSVSSVPQDNTPAEVVGQPNLPPFTLAPILEPVQYNRRHLFDFSQSSKVFYLVANIHDMYVTNSLEKMDLSQFIYRMLREDGYQHIIVVESGDKIEYEVYTYDRDSEQLLVVKADEAKRSSSGAEVGELVKLSRKSKAPSNPTESEEDTRKSGKRLAYGLIGPEAGIAPSKKVDSFQHYIAGPLRDAILSMKKTAVVMPLKLFLETDFLNQNKGKSICGALKASMHNQNILLLTVENVDDMYILVQNEQFGKFDSAVYSAVVELQRTEQHLSHSDAVIRVLQKKNRILIANETPGVDEIANLLLRKKVVENKLKDLPFGKVYSLSEYILRCYDTARNRQLAGSDETYNNAGQVSVKEKISDGIELPFDEWSEFRLKYFEDQVLNFPELADALAKKARELHSRAIVPYQNLPSTAVSRFDRGAQRYIISEEELSMGYQQAMKELNEMIGLSSVKEEISKLNNYQRNLRLEGNVAEGPGCYIFSGNPGTGKTETARLMGRIFQSIGVLERGHVVEVTPSVLVGEHFGAAERITQEKCMEALDGVLFVDEAHNLLDLDSSASDIFASKYAKSAYECIMNFMTNHKERLCVIFAGYKMPMKKFLEADAGMDRRVTEVFYFDDYSDTELLEIIQLMAGKDGFKLSEGYLDAVSKTIPVLRSEKRSSFGNAGEMKKFLLNSKKEYYYRKHARGDKKILTAQDIPEKYKDNIRTPEQRKRDYDDAMSDLNNLIGLGPVKEKIASMFLHHNHSVERGIKKNGPGHYIFFGNPGTGKTTVARLMGRIFKSLELLSSGHVVEVRAGDLIAGYDGQTKQKTRERLEEAVGGVLFVDEAYELVQGSFFAEDAYREIMNFMEDNRDKVSVIFAGYPDIMNTFSENNLGMGDRIDDRIYFPDFSPTELAQILIHMATNQGYTCEAGFEKAAETAAAKLKAEGGKHFGNARAMRKFLKNKIEPAFDLRYETLDENADKNLLLIEDIPAEYRRIDNMPIYSLLTQADWNRFTALPQPLHCEEDWTEAGLFAAARDSILLISTEYGCGTGFLISPDGYALTCNHVIRSSEDVKKTASSLRAKLRLKTAGGQNEIDCGFEVINTKAELDIALIHIPVTHEVSDFLQQNKKDAFPYICPSQSENPLTQGERYLLLGYPFATKESVEPEPFSGIISGSGVVRDQYGFGRANIDGAAKRGNSGSPILSLRDGMVLGILCGANVQRGNIIPEELNFIRPINCFWKEFFQNGDVASDK